MLVSLFVLVALIAIGDRASACAIVYNWDDDHRVLRRTSRDRKSAVPHCSLSPT